MEEMGEEAGWKKSTDDESERTDGKFIPVGENTPRGWIRHQCRQQAATHNKSRWPLPSTKDVDTDDGPHTRLLVIP